MHHPTPTTQQLVVCGNGPHRFEGDILLRVDANVAPLRGVERSCTIYIEGQQRCVHDGGNWYDCPDGHSVDDFVTSICNAFYDKTGGYCAGGCMILNPGEGCLGVRV